MIVALWTACGLVVSYNNPAADFRFALAKPNSDVLVGIDAHGQIVGSVMVGHDGHRGGVYYVSAAPQCRKRGVGCTRMRAAEEWLAERRVPKLQLMVRKMQVVAFYARIGFEAIPRTVMQKWLRP